jgi:hypothetical protein
VALKALKSGLGTIAKLFAVAKTPTQESPATDYPRFDIAGGLEKSGYPASRAFGEHAPYGESW